MPESLCQACNYILLLKFQAPLSDSLTYQVLACSLPTWLYKQQTRLQKRYRLSHGAMLGMGAVFVVLVATLFIAFLDTILAAWPQLLLPQEHAHAQ
jgi:hypothetical protein